MASFYMQWHGAPGLKKMAIKCRFMSQILMEELEKIDIKILTDREQYFDTVAIDVKGSGFTSADYLLAEFHKYGINIRKVNDDIISVSFDEVKSLYDLDQLCEIFANIKKRKIGVEFYPFEEYENRQVDSIPENI